MPMIFEKASALGRALQLAALSLALSRARPGHRPPCPCGITAAGSKTEAPIINQIVTDFNASQSDWTVALQSFPTVAYNDAVVAGALAGTLPDILDVDGPNLPNWAWAGYMQPLPIDETKVSAFLPGTIGRWQGKLYAVGLFDSTISLVTRQSTLDALHLRRPTLEQPWSKDEFMAALQAAKTSGSFPYALDLLNAEQCRRLVRLRLHAVSLELRRRSRRSQDLSDGRGALNGDAGACLRNLVPEPRQGWLSRSRSGPGRPRDRLCPRSICLLLAGCGPGPALARCLPRHGVPARAGFRPWWQGRGGSWQFGVSATSKQAAGAAAFIEFAMQDKYLAAFSDATGLIPATRALQP